MRDKRASSRSTSSRDGFEWALEHGCLSHAEGEGGTAPAMDQFPVRIQWDPERDLHLHKLPYRSIQIGLSKEAVTLYVTQWIRRITDVTPLAHEIHALVQVGRLEDARARLPVERVYR